MKKINRIFHFLLTLSLVLLPMRSVLADFSVIPVGAEMQVADHHTGNQGHHADINHEVQFTANMQADKSSTDCHDHNMTDCETCSLHFNLKDIAIGEIFLTPGLYADYNVPVVAFILSQDIRPPIS